MQHSAVWQANQAIWDQLSKSVNRAVVYLDNKTAELLHWAGGLGRLVHAGAVDVREFSSFESADRSQVKAVFVVSSALEGVTEAVIRDVVTQSSFQVVKVMTSISPLLHEGGTSEQQEDQDFADFEDKLLEWMGNMNYTAQVEHIPLFSTEIIPGVFLAPAFSSLFPLLNTDVRQISHQYSTSHTAKESKQLDQLEDIECQHLPKVLQAQVKGLASGLHAMLQLLDIREDVYSLGQTARMVATELESYPPARARRKACQNRASLLVVDRTLDVTSALTHQTDALMDKLVSSLDALPGHVSDRSVDMTKLCHIVQNAKSQECLLPGSLASTNPTEPSSHLIPLIVKRQKEALMEVNRRLVEAAVSEKLPFDLSSRPGRVTVEQLDATLSLFKGKYNLISKHLDILQVAMATSQTLQQTTSNASWDTMVAKEKSLVQSLGEEEEDVMPSALSVLAKVIMEEKVKDKRSLGLDDILCLLTYLFSVSDGDCGDEDEAATLREQLVEWILADKDSLPPLTKAIVGDTVAENILSDQIENLWEKLTAVGDARSHLQQFRSVFKPGDVLTPGQVTPLLRQVLSKVVDPAKPEMPDIECKTGGLKDLLKSGFGFFKGSAKARPGDCPLFILYVIGGISANEIKHVREVVEKTKPGFEVLVGSSHLSSVSQTMRSLLVDDNINLEAL